MTTQRDGRLSKRKYGTRLIMIGKKGFAVNVKGRALLYSGWVYVLNVVKSWFGYLK